MDATKIARAKDRFLSIKIEKNENLEQFAKRYYVLAQDFSLKGVYLLLMQKTLCTKRLLPTAFFLQSALVT